MEDSSTSIPQNPGFEMEVPLQEDVGAELDYFILLTLLGIDDEASEFALTTLWRHLRHFPVTAEIAGYLVVRNDVGRLKRLLDCLENSHIQFDDADESLLLAHIRQILTDEVATARKWYWGLTLKVRVFADWESPISCLILEMKIIFIARRLPHAFEDVVREALCHCRKLLNRRMFEEGARLFSMACLAASEQGFLVHSLRELFQQAYELLTYSLKQDFWSDGSAKADNESIYIFLVDISYLRLITTATEDILSDLQTRVHIADLLQQTIQLAITNFDTLPDPILRGQHIEFCKSMRRQLADTYLNKDDEHNRILGEQRLNIRRSKVSLLSALPFDMSLMFPIRLIPHGIQSKGIQIERAVECDDIPFHLLSQLAATALGIRWQPFSYKPGPYRIVGLIRLTWGRNEDSDRQSMLRTDIWYITPSKLPDGVQAVVGTSSFSLQSDVTTWTPANGVSQPGPWEDENPEISKQATRYQKEREINAQWPEASAWPILSEAVL